MSTNLFTNLPFGVTEGAMQVYIIVMFLFVAGGTILDMLHKRSAEYFFASTKRAEKSAKRTLSSGEKTSLAISTVTSEVLTSSEFKSTRRRLSHLMTMYGFILFVVSTAVQIFAGAEAASIWGTLWHLGAISLCVGGYWFWFFIRVDVASEGVKWYQLNGRGDFFIVGLITMPTFGLLWSITGHAAFFALFIAFATMLFSTVYWSKFAHMFFKPAAAYQKKCLTADGSNQNLPFEYDLSDPATHARYPDIPEYMGKNPPYMGLGIKREPPNHF
jgi:hypothetical protein